ncbi:RNA-guided endonuclease InsQ/TnpB family protein [Aerosakkonema sp. BLCC-F183]|uniref:RNA-guided endonuclease InsQ/TnpB family protein n=1 Tax=Aerosakkonema sp. BLCC-F183 TaxID=3342834 RepID=UPI0035B7E665
MLLVERHIIKHTHQHWQEIDKLSFLSKNLYNAANYICRQYFFATGKKYKLAELYHLVKNSVDYRALPTKVSKQIVKRLVSTWTGYFEAHKEWNKCPSKFLGEPRIPGYKHKTKGRNAVIYYHESISKAELKQGICHLSMSDIKIPTKVDNVVEVRLVPRPTCYIVEIVYEQQEEQQIDSNYIAAIDLGLTNLVALTSNKGGFRPLLINGRPLKSVNQFYNKTKSKLQSQLGDRRKSSQRIQSLTAYRNNYVDNYLHNTSRQIVNTIKAHGIGTLVIGKNDNWKQNINIGKQNNQSFTHIPHAKFIDQLTYKCQLAGIKVIVTEESYTSKTSALDLESPCQHETYLGKRVKRGLFQSHSGIKINADINGSLQIARKVFPNAYTAEGIARAAVAPLKVLPL